MPSRELRRHASRKRSDSKENPVERKRTTQPLLYGFSVLILVVIVITFIGLPAVRDPGASGGRIEFGSYRGEPIEYFPGNYLAERVVAVDEQLRGEAGAEESDADLEMRSYRVWRTAFEQTVLHTAVLYEAQEGGLYVSTDRQQREFIRNGPYSMGGLLNEERFRRLSKAEQDAALKLFREQLIREQYLRDFLENPLQSPAEISFFRQMMNEQRRFTVVGFPFDDYPEQEVRTFGEANRELFRRIKLSRILIKAGEREAAEVRSKLEERSASFEELARTQSKDLYAEKGGDMGWRYYYDLEGDFESTEPLETIFSLAEGALSPVLESRFGWVIYRADSPVLSLDLNDPEAATTVRDYIMRYEKGSVEDYIITQAQSFRSRVDEVGFTGATLEESYATGLTDYFPLNYQEIYFLAPVRSLAGNLDLASASYSEPFFVAAFGLGIGEVSQPVLLDDQVVVLRLDDVREPPQRQLDLLEDYYDFYAGQALESDFQNILLDPEYLEDNFNETFYQYVFPSQ
ncbi:MAG: peptidylprolyl isomerase [Spirochaetales bacterium]|nr:peptidylprolyl isomerase [Spirochaetales bacterium]